MEFNCGIRNQMAGIEIHPWPGAADSRVVIEWHRRHRKAQLT